MPAGDTVDLVQTEQLPPQTQQWAHGVDPFQPRCTLRGKGTHLQGTEDQKHLVGTAARARSLLKHRLTHFAIQLAGLDDGPYPSTHFRWLAPKITGARKVGKETEQILCALFRRQTAPLCQAAGLVTGRHPLQPTQAFVYQRLVMFPNRHYGFRPALQQRPQLPDGLRRKGVVMQVNPARVAAKQLQHCIGQLADRIFTQVDQGQRG
ncbi:hypothetical protein D3C79_761800 [compost metagenome]